MDVQMLDRQCANVLNQMVSGRVVPFLGAGVNRCALALSATEEDRRLPDGQGLRVKLAEKASAILFDHLDESDLANEKDLLRIAQCFMKDWELDLHETLQELFMLRYPPTVVHHFLATLPERLAKKGKPVRPRLLVTTNYDLVMEAALQSQEIPYDVVAYVKDDKQGRFCHIEEPVYESSDGRMVLSNAKSYRIINDPQRYAELPIDKKTFDITKTIVLKVHGGVDPDTRERSNFVITEDDYVKYLNGIMTTLIPAALTSVMAWSRFLFLGYGLGDWNMRVLLSSLPRKVGARSWAVVMQATSVEKHIWGVRSIDLLPVTLDDFIASLSRAVDGLV